ncbi:EVE domain-containing protein [Dokdonella koreensis]|uniref:RNA-binding protein n=1 Tax=Dokdonella koreensis DS-123 TaxID=1300342 RepID=A0A160DRY3_9GAMM|nr:EVE domain-containing protein [Dokdonella koreensis]ANB16997.1 RNA-binding protein [Dokdonella koreensis DS-123]
MSRHWLMKSEPEEFSIDDLERVGTEPWSGVRNYQARNYMRDGMRIGDGILFYHSNCAEPGIVGLAEVRSEAYPDPSQFQRRSDYYDPASTPEAPRWLLVDVGFRRKLARTITLAELKDRDELGDFALTRRGNRLSVLPVTRTQWDFILALEKPRRGR